MHEKLTKKLLEKVKDDYNSISHEFNQTRKPEWKEFEGFKKYLRENAHIADIGCGNGRLYSFLEKNLKNFQYTGIDNSKNLIEKAKANFSDTTFVLGDLLKIPLTSNSQDIVFCIAAFHHLPSKKLRIQALNEIHRILKKNGTIIISNWNLFQPKYKKYIWKARLKSLFTLGHYAPRDTFIPWSTSGINRYYYAFKPAELRTLLTQAGFEILEETTERNILMICKKA